MEFYGWLALLVLVAIIIGSLVKNRSKDADGGNVGEDDAGTSTENTASPTPQDASTAPAAVSAEPADRGGAQEVAVVPAFSEKKNPVITGLTILGIIVFGGWAIYSMVKMQDVVVKSKEKEKALAQAHDRQSGAESYAFGDSKAKLDMDGDKPATIYGYVKSVAVREEIERIPSRLRRRDVARVVRQMAQSGVSVSQYDLGVCYAMGSPVTLDYEKAVSWFRKAADKGHSGAQYLLGVCYENGLGVKRDVKQAEYWYRKAAEQDDPAAQEALKNLGR